MNAALYRAVMTARFLPRTVPLPAPCPVEPEPAPIVLPLYWSTPIIVDVSDADPVRRVLRSLPTSPTVWDIQCVTAAVYGVTVDDLIGSSQQHRVVIPRHVAMTIAKLLTDESLARVASQFGDRDHTCAVHAVSKYGEHVAAQIDLLGMSSRRTRRRPAPADWTAQQITVLREMYPGTSSIALICMMVGRSRDAVFKKAHELKLARRRGTNV